MFSLFGLDFLLLSLLLPLSLFSILLHLCLCHKLAGGTSVIV